MVRLVAFALGLLCLCPTNVRTKASASDDHQSISVKPGDNLDELVEQHPAGTTFLIKPGIYRLQSIQPKDGDSFVGDPGAVLNGAETLAGFSRSGKFWKAATPEMAPGQNRGQCDKARPACQYPEDLFIDGSPLERVESLGAVGPGKWYLDYSNRTAYLVDDPRGRRAEISVVPHAFWGSAHNVRIAGLTIEKYACLAQDGAVDGRQGRNWVVENNVIQLNHGIGVRTGNGMEVLNNKLIRNGQLGIGGGGDKDIVDGNEVAYNNYAGYDYGWEAGGSKFAFSTNLVVRNNLVHDNNGPGLWTDLENQNTLYDHNHTKSNREAGILHEISYHAVIRNNVIEDDGFSGTQNTAPWYGAGIIVVASSDVEVYGNVVTDCVNGIVGTQPRRGPSRRGTPYLLQNLYVHDNVITQDQGIAAGIVRSALLGDAVFTSWNNRFTNNRFHLADPGKEYFAWDGKTLSRQEWTVAIDRH